ncbi:hypothetical protein PZA11_006001 [Diplocarpon coronariae]
MSHISVENTPQDLLTICAVMQLRTKLNLRTREIVCSINESSDPATPIISLRAIAIADQDGAFPDRALSEFSYHGSAPDLVAAFLAQGAATILYTRGLVARVGGGGVLTPAVLGMDFVERLSRVGVEIGGELI